MRPVRIGRGPDTSPPRGAVGGLRSPAAGVLDLSITAADDGLGLASASATLDGERVAATPLSGPMCADLSPADPTIDLRAGAQCPAVVAGVALRVDTASVPDGPHRLRVDVADAAGNVATIADEETLVLNHPPGTSSTVTLRIGSGGVEAPGPPAAAPAPRARPRLRPAPGPACPVPRLSMLLASKPLRISRGRPVLARGRRYRYRGRLTCRIHGRRRSAPRGTVVEVINVIRGRRRTRRPTRVRARGRIALKLAYPSSRTIIFRHRSVDGRTAQVRIRIRVVRVRGGKERRSR